MIVYVGAHYFIFMKNPDLKKEGYTSNKWKLYNDHIYKEFRYWKDVSSYCLEGGCLPTILIYEKQ